MNVWNNAVITDDGLALQSKLIQGTTLEITRAIAGIGYVTPGLLQEQKEVIDAKQELVFHPVSYPEYGKCKLTLTLTNDEVTTGHTIRQIYIMAKDPDKGEIVYFIAQSVDAEHGTIVPAAAEMPGYSAEWTFYFQYGRADGVNVVVDPTGYVSREEMEAYVTEIIKDINIASITEYEIDTVFPGSGGSTGGEGGTVVTDINPITNPEIDSITDKTE